MGLIAWWRRRRARRAPFEPRWREVLAREVPFHAELADADRPRFETRLKVFLLTTRFEGVGGFALEEWHRVVIAAVAARLALNLPGEPFARLAEVLVYPGAYRHPDGGEAAVFGEVNRFGTLVLAWSSVVAGLRATDDGHDTALHELAHVLDRADGAFDGTPLLARAAAYRPWAEVMAREFLALRDGTGRGGRGRARRGRGRRTRHALRAYGATNEAEFFAVASEAFFERPRAVRDRHPELYAILAAYYRQDPARD